MLFINFLCVDLYAGTLVEFVREIRKEENFGGNQIIHSN